MGKEREEKKDGKINRLSLFFPFLFLYTSLLIFLAIDFRPFNLDSSPSFQRRTKHVKRTGSRNGGRIKRKAYWLPITLPYSFSRFTLISLFAIMTTGSVLLAPSAKQNYDLMYYLKGAAAGGICCSITHGALTPVDVVKTRVQLDPVKVSE